MAMKRATLPLSLIPLLASPLSAADLPLGKPEDVDMSTERLRRIHDAVQRHIDAGENLGRCDARGLAWSPDGKHIAMRAQMAGKPFKIYLISAQGGEPQELIPQHREEEGIPTWSRDAKQIVFSDVPGQFHQGTGNEVLHVYDLKTHDLSSLPGSKGLWTSRWSPDGRYIAALTVADQEVDALRFSIREMAGLAC